MPTRGPRGQFIYSQAERDALARQDIRNYFDSSPMLSWLSVERKEQITNLLVNFYGPTQPGHSGFPYTLWNRFNQPAFSARQFLDEREKIQYDIIAASPSKDEGWISKVVKPVLSFASQGWTDLYFKYEGTKQAKKQADFAEQIRYRAEHLNMETENSTPAGTGYKTNNEMPSDQSPTITVLDPKKLRPDFSPLILVLIGIIAVFYFRR
jgi:hypothetical protein